MGYLKLSAWHTFAILAYGEGIWTYGTRVSPPRIGTCFRIATDCGPIHMEDSVEVAFLEKHYVSIYQP